MPCFPRRLALLLLVVGLSSMHGEAQSDEFVDAALGERLNKQCVEAEKTGFSGTVLVRRGEQTLLVKGYGLADRETGIANGPETLFEVASLSKQFTAAAVLALAQDGRLTLDDPLGRYVPGVPDAYRSVTVHQALTHTGGLPRGGSGRGLDLAAATGQHLASEPLFPPGEGYAYSNVGYALLAGSVDEASGESLETYSRERLFRRAGMRSTSFCGRPIEGRVAIGYSKRSGEPRSAWRDPYAPDEEFGYEYRGMGGVVTNVLDLERWVAALQSDAVLNAAARKTFFSPTEHGYACGWEVFETRDGRRCVVHGGSVWGYTSKLWWFPDNGALVIVLANQDDFDYSLLTRLTETLFERSATPVEPVETPRVVVDEATRRQLQALAGEYPSVDIPGLRLRLQEKSGVLVADFVIDSSQEAPKDPVAQAAAELVRSVAAGDAAPLAQAMAPRIPKSWPARLTSAIWPRHLEQWGELGAVEPLAVTTLRGRPPGWRGVWLVLRHERGNCLAMVGYRPSGRLQLLMLSVKSTLGFGETGLTLAGENLLRSNGSPNASVRFSAEADVVCYAPSIEMRFVDESGTDDR